MNSEKGIISGNAWCSVGNVTIVTDLQEDVYRDIQDSPTHAPHETCEDERRPPVSYWYVKFGRPRKLP
jgi:hypothetical protein